MLNLETASLMKKEIPYTDCPDIALDDSCGLMNIFILPDDPAAQKWETSGPFTRSPRRTMQARNSNFVIKGRTRTWAHGRC